MKEKKKKEKSWKKNAKTIEHIKYKEKDRKKICRIEKKVKYSNKHETKTNLDE